MKVLQFVCDGAPGGGTNHVLQVLKDSRRDSVLLTQQDSYLAKQAQSLGIPVHTGNFFRSRVDRRAIQRVEEVCRQVQPDMLHCHGGRAAFFSSSIKRGRIPKIYTVHGFHFARKPLLSKTKGWLGELKSIHSVDHVVFVSQYDANIARQFHLLPPKKPHTVIHNGIVAPTPRDVVPSGKIGFIGRFVYQKNPELFVQMMQRLPTRQAVMVGGGALEEKLTDMIRKNGLQDRIQRLGALPHHEALDVLASLDVLVMTPRWEGLPLLPLEAMLMQVPVVSTDVGGIPEVITHMQHGLLVAGRSADGLAASVDLLEQDPALRQQLVADALHQARDHFAESRMLNQLETLYQQMLSPTTCLI